MALKGLTKSAQETKTTEQKIEEFISGSSKRVKNLEASQQVYRRFTFSLTEEVSKEIDEKMLTVSLESDITGTIKKSNLSKDKNEQRTDRFAIDEQVDSIIISVDQKLRTINLSIKEVEIQDEKEALTKYGSSDSGASLGDILGSILKKKE